MQNDATWEFTLHACRACMGRILRHGAVFRCAICEVDAIGAPEGICGCGLRVKDARSDGGFRCAPNPQRSPASPAAVIISFAAPATAGEASSTAE